MRTFTFAFAIAFASPACLGLFASALSVSRALRQPCDLQAVPPCTLAFAAHGGLGNQLVSALRVAWIARAAGCSLVLPRLLDHGLIERITICGQELEVALERLTVEFVSRLYLNHSGKSYTDIFQLKPAGAVNVTIAPAGFTLAEQIFLPHKCTLLTEEMQGDTCRYSNHLRGLIAAHSASQSQSHSHLQPAWGYEHQYHPQQDHPNYSNSNSSSNSNLISHSNWGHEYQFPPNPDYPTSNSNSHSHSNSNLSSHSNWGHKHQFPQQPDYPNSNPNSDSNSNATLGSSSSSTSNSTSKSKSTSTSRSQSNSNLSHFNSESGSDSGSRLLRSGSGPGSGSRFESRLLSLSHSHSDSLSRLHIGPHSRSNPNPISTSTSTSGLRSSSSSSSSSNSRSNSSSSPNSNTNSDSSAYLSSSTSDPGSTSKSRAELNGLVRSGSGLGSGSGSSLGLGWLGFTIGSAFSLAVPKLHLSDIFSDLNETLKQGALEMQTAIAERTGSPVGAYSCMHIRTKDEMSTADPSLGLWIQEEMLLQTHDDFPMFLMTLIPWSGLKQDVALASRCKAVGCVTAEELLYSHPKDERLFLEMVLCALAQNLYLPNLGGTVVNEIARKTRQLEPNSTLSWTIRAIHQELPTVRALRERLRVAKTED